MSRPRNLRTRSVDSEDAAGDAGGMRARPAAAVRSQRGAPRLVVDLGGDDAGGPVAGLSNGVRRAAPLRGPDAPAPPAVAAPVYTAAALEALAASQAWRAAAATRAPAAEESVFAGMSDDESGGSDGGGAKAAAFARAQRRAASDGGVGGDGYLPLEQARAPAAQAPPTRSAPPAARAAIGAIDSEEEEMRSWEAAMAQRGAAAAPGAAGGARAQQQPPPPPPPHAAEDAASSLWDAGEGAVARELAALSLAGAEYAARGEEALATLSRNALDAEDAQRAADAATELISAASPRFDAAAQLLAVLTELLELLEEKARAVDALEGALEGVWRNAAVRRRARGAADAAPGPFREGLLGGSWVDGGGGGGERAFARAARAAPALAAAAAALRDGTSTAPFHPAAPPYSVASSADSDGEGAEACAAAAPLCAAARALWADAAPPLRGARGVLALLRGWRESPHGALREAYHALGAPARAAALAAPFARAEAAAWWPLLPLSCAPVSAIAAFEDFEWVRAAGEFGGAAIAAGSSDTGAALLAALSDTAGAGALARALSAGALDPLSPASIARGGEAAAAVLRACGGSPAEGAAALRSAAAAALAPPPPPQPPLGASNEPLHHLHAALLHFSCAEAVARAWAAPLGSAAAAALAGAHLNAAAPHVAHVTAAWGSHAGGKLLAAGARSGAAAPTGGRWAREVQAALSLDLGGGAPPEWVTLLRA
jgi:hypothetical protein